MHVISQNSFKKSAKTNFHFWSQILNFDHFFVKNRKILGGWIPQILFLSHSHEISTIKDEQIKILRQKDESNMFYWSNEVHRMAAIEIMNWETIDCCIISSVYFGSLNFLIFEKLWKIGFDFFPVALQPISGRTRSLQALKVELTSTSQ